MKTTERSHHQPPTTRFHQQCLRKQKGGRCGCCPGGNYGINKTESEVHSRRVVYSMPLLRFPSGHLRHGRRLLSFCGNSPFMARVTLEAALLRQTFGGWVPSLPQQFCLTGFTLLFLADSSLNGNYGKWEQGHVVCLRWGPWWGDTAFKDWE